MEDKIEVGEYVRTKEYGISKVIKVLNNRVFVDNLGFAVINKDIAKHSKNIIDLIEVEDIVKYRINDISTALERKGYIQGIRYIEDKEMLENLKDKNLEILSILTKEQYENNCYKVEEE